MIIASIPLLLGYVLEPPHSIRKNTIFLQA